MSPNKLLGDHILWYCAQLVEVGSLLKLDVHAAGKANISLTNEGGLVHTEGELRLSATILEAGKCVVSNFLGESKGHESLFNFFLLFHHFGQFDFLS